MTAQRIAGVVLVAGAMTFLVGAAIGVPTVFTERDPEVRLRLLQDGLTRWQVAQPLYGLGPLMTAGGMGLLVAGASSRATRAAFAAAALATLMGALAWGWSLYLRGTRVAEFATGTLPAWPFWSYVLLTVIGLAALGVGLLGEALPRWLGWLTIGADLLFLAAFLWLRDIPPFVFYLLLLVVGAVAVTT
jgi:hypothetical protein